MRLWLRDSVDPFPIITCQRMVASYMACFHFLPIHLPALFFFFFRQGETSRALE